MVKVYFGLWLFFNMFIMSFSGVGNVVALSFFAIFLYVIMGVLFFGDEIGFFEGGVLLKYLNF